MTSSRSFILAEKPSAAKQIAKAFKYKQNSEGFYEIKPCEIFPSGAVVGFAVGHLLQLADMDAYDEKYKKWSIEDLPIIPQKFKYTTTKQNEKILTRLKDHLNRSEYDQVICATDAEVEGEHIFWTIYNYSGSKKPVKRLWISSLTPDAIREGFKKLKAGKLTLCYHYQGQARSIADWLVGLNITRLIHVSLQEKGIADPNHGVYSVGRVQTSLLKIIVDREKAINDFVSTPFWTIEAIFNIEGKEYAGRWFRQGPETRTDRFEKLENAEEIVRFCEGKPVRVVDVKKDRKEYKSPVLFSLSGLQSEAGKRLKMGPKQCLDVAQSLYSKGYLSYPRTNSIAITESEAKQLPSILSELGKLEEYKDIIPTPKKSIIRDLRYVNSKKVSDHHALIPTEQIPNLSNLSENEKKIYDLVVRRVIAAHYEDAVYDYTTVETIVDEKETFESKGKVLITEGWRRVIYPNGTQEDEQTEALPRLEAQEKGFVQEVLQHESKTSPPKRFSESELIQVMKTAGKYLDGELEDETLETMIDTLSIGTEATRAQIITTLKDRGFIKVEKHKVFAEPKGILLIEALGSETFLCSPELTARWEQQLVRVGRGEVDHKQFIAHAIDLTKKMVINLRESTKKWELEDLGQQVSQDKHMGLCLLCKQPVAERGSLYGCQGYKETGCNFKIPKVILKKKIPEAQVRKLLETGRTDVIKGFQGKKPFKARLKWHPDKSEIKFEFEQEIKDEYGNCLKCDEGILVDRGDFIGCTQYPTCTFTISKIRCKKKIPKSQIKKIVHIGQSDMMDGFIGRNGKEFSARLYYSDGEIRFSFD